MTTLALLDWDELSEAESRALVTSPAMTFDVAAQLLSPSLSVLDELSVKVGGDVHWLGDATVHRDASFTLLDPLPWGTALVRLRCSLADPTLGLAAIRDVGAFCTHTPDDVLGEKVLDDSGQWRTAWEVTGQDRLYLLDRQVGRSYVVTAGTAVLDAVRAVYGDAGITGFLIDSTASDVAVPVTMTWPLIPSTASSDGDSSPTTWLRIVNDLHALINYRGAWADEHGYLRSTPYVNPADQASRFAFDATDLLRCPVGRVRTRSQDLYGIPNVWIFTRDNLDADVVPVDGAGMYIVENFDDGLSSINARGGDPAGRWPMQIPLSAADQATLVALGDARVAADKRGVTTFKVPTSPWPCAGHFDTFVYCESDFGGSVAVQATEWTLPLDGSDMDWIWQAI